MINKNNIFLVPVHGIAMFFVTVMLIALPAIINIAAAATWYVSNDDSSADTNGGTSWGDAFKTIQRGIEESTTGDTVLVADGTYTGTRNKNIELQGKAISVKSLNGPENCVIDCENSGRGFYIHEGEGFDTIISGFTIKNGTVGSNYGGAIYCDSSNFTIDNCIMKSNNGSTGGAIGLLYAGATIRNCKFINNNSQYGGGIYSVFPWNATNNLIIVNSIFYGNYASGRGGAILFAGPFSGAYLKVINSTIAGNKAVDGGGFSLESCAGETITDSILYDNAPDAVWVNNCSPVITYSAGSGIVADGNIEEDPLFLNIPALWDRTIASSTTTTIRVFDETLYAMGDVIEINDDGVVRTVTSVSGDIVTFEPALESASTNSMLIENWGAGVTDLEEDFHLYSSSQCIDAGYNPITGILDLDLDGKPRFIDGDGDEFTTTAVDMGAYEYGDICECDSETPMDLDTDGLDLADYISNPGSYGVSILAEDFGRVDCPNYQYTP